MEPDCLPHFKNQFRKESLSRIPWAGNLPSGYPDWDSQQAWEKRISGQTLLQEIREASAAGQKTFRVPAGDYLFNGDHSEQSTLSGLADLEILAEGATFWFEPPLRHGLLFDNCRNVTVRGLTIDFTMPCWFQAEILTVDPQNQALTATVMPGYEPINPLGKPESAGERACMFYDASGRFINHRHTPTKWWMEEGGILHCVAGRFGLPAGLKPGDYIVGSLHTGMALRSNHCARMHYEAVNVWSSPGPAVWEGNGQVDLPEHLRDTQDRKNQEIQGRAKTGGHLYKKVRATRRPETNRLHAFGSDIFHLVGSDLGPELNECELAYGSDDTFNIHGNFGRVVEAVDATHVYLQGEYAVGDRLEFRDFSSLELLGSAQVLQVKATPEGPSLPINESYRAQSEYRVQLDQPLNLPPLSLVVLDGKQSNEGFVVRNCWIHDDFQRSLINGSPKGLVENNLFENLGYGLCVQFETWGPWMEGPFARDLVIRGNHFVACAPEEPVIAVAMFPPGKRKQWDAMPVSNLTIEDNFIDAASGFPLKIHNVDGLTIQNNHIQLTPLSKAIPRKDWCQLKDPACGWSQGSADTARHWLDLQDCANVVCRRNQLTRQTDASERSH